MRYTEELLLEMAENNPKALIECIDNNNFIGGLLAIAAEAVGKIKDNHIALPALYKLLDNTDLVVKEGVLCGLSNQLSMIENPIIRLEIKSKISKLILDEDSIPLIVEIAKETLDE